MGIYTNIVNEASYGPAYATDYRDYEPYSTGDSFHALGIQIATECAANSNAFMKAIALEELACYEQTGSTDALYESVNVKGIFEKIKMIFKKIIDKIQKLFHTFLAKFRTLYMSGKDFAKKYRTEIIKNWAKVDSDWEFKGYKFEHIPTETDKSNATKDVIKSNTNYANLFNKIIIDIKNSSYDSISSFISACDTSSTNNIKNALKPFITKTEYSINNANKRKYNVDEIVPKTYDSTDLIDDAGNIIKNAIDDYKVIKAGYLIGSTEIELDLDGQKEAISKCRTNMSNKEDELRGAVFAISCTGANSNSIDSKEFSEELFKYFRNGEDDKEDLKKSDIENTYGSISGLVTRISEFEKVKGFLEKEQKSFVSSIDDLIKVMNKAQDELIKENKTNKDTANTKANETLVSLGSLYQLYWEKIKEYQIQIYAAKLTALKDDFSQARAIAVKTIGLNKKMVKAESYDYGNSYSSGSSFIDSVQIV